MKKVIVFFILTVVLAFVLSGCIINADGTSLEVYKYDNAEKYSSGEFEYDATKIKSITIGWVHDGIEIIGSSVGSTVKLSEENSKTDDQYAFRHYLDESGHLDIRFVESGTILPNDYVFWTSKKLSIVLPTAYVDLTKIKLNTVSAYMDISNVKASTIGIESVSGKINIHSCDVDRFDTNTVSSSINFTGMVETIDITTVSSNCEFSISSKTKLVDVDTVSGNVKLNFDSSVTGYTLDFDSISGKHETQISPTITESQLVFGDGALNVKMKSVSANLYIKTYYTE